MTIQDLISVEAQPLRPEDSAEHALGLLMEHRVRHLPVVDAEGLLVGVISEDQLLESASGPDAPISSLLGMAPVAAAPDVHLFEVTKLMVEHGLTTLPIADVGATTSAWSSGTISSIVSPRCSLHRRAVPS